MEELSLSGWQTTSHSPPSLGPGMPFRDEGRGLDLEALCGQAQYPDEYSSNSLGEGATHVLVPGYRRSQLPLEPPLELIEVAEGQSLHFHVGEIVVTPGALGLDRNLEDLAKHALDLLQRVQLAFHPGTPQGLHPVASGERIEDHAGLPLVLALLAVEDAVLPELDQNPDAKRESGMDGFQEERIGHQVSDLDPGRAGRRLDEEPEGNPLLGSQAKRREPKELNGEEENRQARKQDPVRIAG